MTITFLDDNYNPASAPIDDYRSLVWSRNWYSHDSFSLVLSGVYASMAKNHKFIWLSGTDRLGLITSYSYNDEGGAKSLTINGYGANSLLDSRTTIRTETINGQIETMLRNLVQRHAMTGNRAIYGLSFDTIRGITNQIDTQITGKNLSDYLYETLRPFGLSYYIRFDQSNSLLLFGLRSGIDRSQNQNNNPYALFSSSFGNLVTTDYNYNRGNWYNFAYVAGEESGTDRVIFELDMTGGDERREIFIDARDIQSEYRDDDGNIITISQNDYLELLNQRGIKKLNEYNIIENINAEIDIKNMKYGIDFDIGDICGIMNSDIGLSWAARLTSIDEVYESGEMRIVPIFGDKLNLLEILKRELVV